MLKLLQLRFWKPKSSRSPPVRRVLSSRSAGRACSSVWSSTPASEVEPITQTPPNLAEIPAWPVPPSIRRQPECPVREEEGYVRMMGLEEVFPEPVGSALAEAWDTDAAFR